MQQKKLGKSDVSVSSIGLGCWAFGGGTYWGKQSQEDVNETVHAALDKGINFFDTAEVYNKGENEIALGKALAGRRNEAVICSKISPHNAAHIREHLLDSLKRLGTDYLDMYMLHWPLNPVSLQHFTAEGDSAGIPSITDIYHQLTALKKEGLIRCIGMSNFGAKQMAEVTAAQIQVDFNEIAYNIVSRAIEAEVVPFCQKNNISIIGSMALQQGFLSGKYSSPEEIPPAQAHSRHFKQIRGGAESRHREEGAEEEMFEVLSFLRSVSSETGFSLVEIAIAWVLNKPFIASTLAGSRNTKQLEANVAAGDLQLPSDVIMRIDEAGLPVLKKLGDSPDYYENREKTRIY